MTVWANIEKKAQRINESQQLSKKTLSKRKEDTCGASRCVIIFYRLRRQDSCCWGNTSMFLCEQLTRRQSCKTVRGFTNLSELSPSDLRHMAYDKRPESDQGDEELYRQAEWYDQENIAKNEDH